MDLSHYKSPGLAILKTVINICFHKGGNIRVGD
jgi:hypothetical protein